jgi:glycosyltransferase involved in cell wall biosynthesis
MKVLWLSNVPSPYRVDFFNRLGERIELTVLFEMNNASDRDKNWAAGTFKNFSGFILKGIRTEADKSFCPTILRWLQRGKYQIVIISNYSTPTGMLAIEWLRLKGMPFVIQADGGFFKSGTGKKEKLKKHLISSAEFWLSSGGKTTEYLVAYGARQDGIYVFPFSSITQTDILAKKLDFDEKKKLRNQLGIQGDKIAISVGQFIHRKGFDILIRAWTRMKPEYALLIIGGGELEQELAEMIRQNFLANVHLVGFKCMDELYQYYMASDLFILPTREDIWGLVVNEAMACGLPVITTDKCIAGLELIEDNKSGFVVQADNEEVLFEKAEYLLSHDDIREAMADNCLDTIRGYTIEKMTAVHVDIFNKLVQAHKFAHVPYIG